MRDAEIEVTGLHVKEIFQRGMPRTVMGMDDLLRVVFVGEVDSGKSTLIGRLLLDTDSLSRQEEERLERASKGIRQGIDFAHILDSFEEERRQELTLDTTQAYLKTQNREFLLIDVPGHIHLLKNILTGASYADVAVFILDIQRYREGLSRRHLYILKFLGIEDIVVAVNKMDLVSYREKDFIEVGKRIEDILKDAGLDTRAVVPLSALEGENLIRKSSRLDWHNGPFLLEAMAGLRKKDFTCDFRLPVQDIYSDKGERIVVGTIASGRVSIGDAVKIPSSGEEFKVKSIRVFNKRKQSAGPQESIGLVLDGLVKHSPGRMPEFKRGDVLYSGRPPEASSQLHARIFCLAPIDKQDELSVVCATQEVRGKVSQIRKRVETENLEIEEGRQSLNGYDAAEVLINTRSPLVRERFQDLPWLGRFVLRKDSEISAVGVID